MCVTCGCADDAQVTFTPVGRAAPGTVPQPHTHVLADGTQLSHTHPAVAAHGLEGGESPVPLPSTLHTPGTTLALETKLLAKNDLIAAHNREWLRQRHLTALNWVSSPGAGKTTLLVRTIADLQAEMPIAVIEGDQATTHDAERIAATGCATLQVNTGTGCHLEAAMVERGLVTLDPPPGGLVLIENVGNLVCPALFDLGEAAKVVMLSVTEGEDKPLKYPHMFRASQVMVLTKIDLLPYVNFEVDRCLAYARQVNPALQIFLVSAVSGAGLEAWYDWLRAIAPATRSGSAIAPEQ